MADDLRYGALFDKEAAMRRAVGGADHVERIAAAGLREADAKKP